MKIVYENTYMETVSHPVPPGPTQYLSDPRNSAAARSVTDTSSQMYKHQAAAPMYRWSNMPKPLQIAAQAIDLFLVQLDLVLGQTWCREAALFVFMRAGVWCIKNVGSEGDVRV